MLFNEPEEYVKLLKTDLLLKFIIKDIIVITDLIIIVSLNRHVIFNSGITQVFYTILNLFRFKIE